MILSKHPCRFFEKQFNSKFDRTLLLAEPINGIDNKRVVIATSHFESNQSNDDTRKHQMNDTFEILGNVDSIVCGDFNFDNSSKSEAAVYKNAGYEDVLCRWFKDGEPQSFTRY